MEKEEEKKEKPSKTKKKGETLVKNTIELNPTLNEAEANASDKTAVVGWGRMNPITIGHEKLVNKIKSVARQKSATPLIYVTHSQDKKKNPLSYNDKVTLAKKAFGAKIFVKSPANTIIKVMQELEKKYDNVVLVAGSDRVPEFEGLLKKYNGKDYTFKSIEVVSAGERDPDAEGVEGMSASKMRAAAADGDFKSFRSGLPKKLQRDAKSIYDMVRGGMKLAKLEEEMESLDEVMTVQQRRKRALTMRRYKTKIAMARKRMRRRFADASKLKTRSRKKAIQLIRKKVAGKQGANYKDLSPAQKMLIDKKVAKRKAVIDRIAKRLLPQVKKADRQKFMTKSEEINPVLTPDNETPRQKRYHQMFNKEGSIKLDGRFKAFKKKQSQFEEVDDVELLQLIEEITNTIDEKSLSDNDPWGIKKLKSVTVNRKKYAVAAQLLKKLLARKKKEKPGRHSPVYYAQVIAKQFDDVDAKTLAKMVQEEGGAGDRGTEKVTKRYKKDTPGETVSEQKVAQDPDVKDQPGTQPKKYYKGLSDSEKEARAKQFRKGVKADDDSPSSYKSAPGDDDAKTKESKHTKKYRQMYGESLEEGPNMERAKDQIKRIRNRVRKEVDQIQDRARAADVQRKNRSTRPQLATETYELTEESKEALMKKADKSGIPYSILKKVYDRGMAAWKTGHRPGATQQQWAYARVNSFITKSKGTWGGADKDLASKVKKESVEMNEASKVPAGMKFIASYVYKDANGKDHTHRHFRKGSKMTDPVVVYIDGKEWKTFQSFTKAKQAAINHIKGIKESVNEEVNMKNVDKLKTAARDFSKNKSRNFQSISDALSQIVFSMRRLDKSTSGRTDYKHERIVDKEISRINSISDKAYGTEEGKEIRKLLTKHGLVTQTGSTYEPMMDLIYEARVSHDEIMKDINDFLRNNDGSGRVGMSKRIEKKYGIGPAQARGLIKKALQSKGHLPKTGPKMRESVEEAVSPAQQAAIAISKKERGEEPKKTFKEVRKSRKMSAQDRLWKSYNAYTKRTTGKSADERVKELEQMIQKMKKDRAALDEQDPCWDGYKQVGMKKGKKGKPVPNCVKEVVRSKTIKVGEDAIGADETHYALVKEREVVAIGNKEDMLSLHREEGGRVWISTKQVGDLVEEVTQQQINDLEKFADRLLNKFDVDIEFTRHFADRLNDPRNKPAITVAELQRLFKKMADNKGKRIKKHGNAEAVLKDMQSDLNLPVVVNWKNGEFEVVNKTIMRKKAFKTPNPVIKYE